MTAPAARTARTPRIATTVLAAAVIVATILALVPSPVPLRLIVVFPLLVLVAGHSATRLLFTRGERDDDYTGPEHVLWTVLPVLFGLLSLLAVVLLLAALGVPIAATGIAVGTGAAALLLLLLDRWRTLLRSKVDGFAAASRSPHEVGRRVAGPVLAVLVLAAAVAGAAALRPTPVEQYSQLVLDEPGVIAGQPLSTHAGGQVALRWVLSGHGSALAGAEPAVDVVVGGTPASGVSSVVGTPKPAAAPGAVDDRHGSVRFTAPTAPGLYEVRVTVGSGAASMLVVQLEVKS